MDGDNDRDEARFRKAVEGQRVQTVKFPTDQTLVLQLEDGTLATMHYRVTYDGDWMELEVEHLAHADDHGPPRGRSKM